MYMPKEGTDIKQVSFTGKQFYSSLAIFSIILITILSLLIGLVTNIYQNQRIISLKKDKSNLQQELLVIKENVTNLNELLVQLEGTADELRNVANLPPIDQDIRKVGVGGPSNYGALDFVYYPDEISKTALEINLDLNKLERGISLEKSSMIEISSELSNQKERIDHFPSIMPILGGRITDGFGYRFHPVTRRTQMHPGVDIPMPVGTKVLATADGVVDVVRLQKNMHKEYGIYIKINHGYGYETKYCHLSSVSVKVGQKVKRWEPIGEVGRTGRTTGYHLHYEVVSERSRVDPEFFIFN